MRHIASEYITRLPGWLLPGLHTDREWSWLLEPGDDIVVFRCNFSGAHLAHTRTDTHGLFVSAGSNI